MYYMMVIFIFITCYLLVVGGLYKYIIADRKARERITYYVSSDKSSESRKTGNNTNKENTLKRLNSLIKRSMPSKHNEKLENLVRSAGASFSADEYGVFRIFFTALCGLLAYLIVNKLFIVPVSLIMGYVLPHVWLKKKVEKRLLKFNDGLPDMLTIVSGALRTGYSFTQCLKTVSEECDSPIKEEISLLVRELAYGVSMEQGFANLLKRVPSEELEMLVQAVLIQREVGGNLIDIVEIILETIRDRVSIQGQVKALSAQGKISGRVVGSLPLALGVLIYFINADYMKVLFTTSLGLAVLSYGIVSCSIGFFCINKLTKIDT